MIQEKYPKVFTWLFIGLIITFLTGYSLSLYPYAALRLNSGGTYIILAIIEIAIAIFFSTRLHKMSKLTAIICYIIYSFLTGITFGVIFLAFKLSSIMSIFLITSIVFLAFAVIGMTTKKDLSKMSMWLLMSLLAILVAGIVKIFLKSSMLDLIITIIYTIVFIAYIIYDMKNAEYIIREVGEDKGAIYGAFQLYLDFINLFINLLKLLGKANDN